MIATEPEKSFKRWKQPVFAKRSSFKFCSLRERVEREFYDKLYYKAA